MRQYIAHSNRLTDQQPKKQSQYSTTPHTDPLKHLLKSYVLPSISSPVKTVNSDEESKSDKLAKYLDMTSTNNAVPKLFTISHNQLIYPSVETSKKILRDNKVVYERMRTILENVEAKTYRSAVDTCRAKKKRLNYFNCRARAWSPRTRRIFCAMKINKVNHRIA